MKPILVLKFLETNFNKQSKRIKIELVLFPFLIFLTLIIVINETRTIEPINDIKIEINDNTSNIIMEYKIVDILNDLEKFTKSNKIHLNKISNNNQSVKIELKTNLIKQLLFIKFIEDYNSFSKIKYLKQEEDLLLLEIVFDKLYMKKSFNLKSILHNLEKDTNTSFKLSAIVGNSVLINNKWLKKDEIISSFKITDVRDNNVYLNNGFKTIKLKINKNENN